MLPDPAEVAEALEWEDDYVEILKTRSRINLKPLEAVFDSARVYADSQEVWWCGFHQAAIREPTEEPACIAGWLERRSGAESSCHGIASGHLIALIAEDTDE